MLGVYGTTTALRSLAGGDLAAGNLKTLVHPVNCWRHAAFRFVRDRLKIEPGERVFDLGSPKLFSLYAADRLRAEVWAADLSGYFLRRLRRYRRVRNVPENRLPFLLLDGRRLPLTERFHKFFSISVVEHIPGDGDRECMRELGRILLPGGRGAVTVPFSPRGEIQYRRDDFYWSGCYRGAEPGAHGRVFYQRVYSERDLEERLAAPSGLKLVELAFLGTRAPGAAVNRFASVPGPVQGLGRRLFISGPKADWRETGRPSAAFLVLEKAR